MMVVDGDDVDVAVLRCDAVTGQVKHLTLSTAQPQPGHEVIVLGYPTGMWALLARTSSLRMHEQLLCRRCDSHL